MDLKKMLGIFLIIIVVVFALMLTTSYAWYSYEKSSTKFDVVTADQDVDIIFQSGDYISTDVAIPIKDSDVDFYYEGRVPSLLTLDLIQSDLERLIGCHVDMVRLRENMNILLKERIQKEGLYV